MSRISNNSFKVNAALEQIVEISNATAIPVSEEADITKWGGAATTLGSKASAASVPVVIANDQAAIPISTASTLDVDLDSVSGTAITLGQKAMVASLPVVIASNQGSVPISTTTTLDVDLDSVSGAAITLGQKVKATSLPVVLASDGAVTSGADTTLAAAQQVGAYGWDGSAWRQVQVSATGVLKTESELETHSGSEGNLDSSSVVAGGDTSTSISTTNKTIISIFGNHSVASAELQIQVSADGSTFYPNGYSIFADANGDFYSLFEGCANNIRLKYTTAGTVTATLLANSH